MSVYINYIKGHEQAIREFANLEKKTFFTSFLKKIEETNKSIKSLPNILIMPVQRLPRFILLLKTLSEKTVTSHPDFSYIQVSLSLLSSLVESVDETIKQEENLQKIYSIQKRLGVTVTNFLFLPLNLFLIYS